MEGKSAPRGVEGASSSAPGAHQQVKAAQTPAGSCPSALKLPVKPPLPLTFQT